MTVSAMNRSCRFCNRDLTHELVDLGVSPLSNTYLRSEDLVRMEPFYPLVPYVCDRCFLVQLPAVETPERIFRDYAYFSSYSDTWLAHARDYCAAMTARFGLGSRSLVVEIASNDGYLLQNFVAAGIPSLGVEPAANVARVAREKGIDTEIAFFGRETAARLARERRQADLLLGNNVLAHVPDLADFVSGLEILLAPDGVVTMEFPHLLELVLHNQFDTIYHEHFSYFSLLTVRQIFDAHGLQIFDVDRLPTHGGSLRIYAAHTGRQEIDERVHALEAEERTRGLDRLETYQRFGEQVRQTKRALLDFLIRAKEEGKRVVAYGAPAKGNTLLNYCGIRTDFIDYTVDRSPHKQGLFLPGTRIPIHAPERIRETRPDYVLILPWNLREEIVEQMRDVREWGGRFVIPIPRVEVVH
ncbi:MAG TPA: class I SAM-dependent methyltransferase [Thermoanaerobaculia bacterium]|jgi:SAM-dependent methyltransferase|nr:class I SAM-dependent methyltransferase [Thermoanaerobaculia bacterium]